MTISVIHPSIGRPQQAFETYKKWRDNADSDFEYLLSTDESDERLIDYCNAWPDNERYGKAKGGAVCNDNKSAIEAINNAAKIATGDLFVVISDDFNCPPHWDALLLNELAGKQDFVLKTRDGIQKTLVTLPIMDRVFYKRYGYVYHPEYLHMGCDVELTAVAIMTGKLLYSDLLFTHNHYSTGKTPKDAINEKNDLTYQHGDEVLARHRANNFGIVNPIIQYSEIVWH